MLGFRRAMERVKFAGGGVPFHLPIPIVILEWMQKRFQLATLLERELVNRSLDFSSRAHGGKLNAEGGQRQPARGPHTMEHSVFHREMDLQVLNFEERHGRERLKLGHKLFER